LSRRCDHASTVTLTEGETKALLASSLLVLLAALGRVTLTSPAPNAQVGLTAPENADSALAVAEAMYAEEERRREPLAPGELIDPNLANEVELDRLPGIGPATARAIVRSRAADGPFLVLGDLERVTGLGSTTVQRLEPHVALPGSVNPGGSGREPGRPSQPNRDEKWRRKLDVNRASAQELEALPGIGAVRAEAIVNWRRQHGPFRNLEQLLEVRGIGAATLERLRPYLVAGP
jgi:competence ComEA-like helix-hairpin-helix protein